MIAISAAVSASCERLRCAFLRTVVAFGVAGLCCTASGRPSVLPIIRVAQESSVDVDDACRDVYV